MLFFECYSYINILNTAFLQHMVLCGRRLKKKTKKYTKLRNVFMHKLPKYIAFEYKNCA